MSDLAATGRAVADLIGGPLADVTAAMHLSKGIVARSVDAEPAREIQSALSAMGLSTALIPEAQMIRPEATRLLRRVVVQDGALQGESANAADEWQEIAIAVHNLLFACAVRLRWTRLVVTTDETPAQAKVREQLERSVLGRFATRRIGGKKNRKAQTIFVPSYQYLLTLFTREPLVRYDVHEASFDFELMQAVPAEFGVAASLAGAILEAAPGVPTNSGFRLLSQGQTGPAWERITFDSRAGAASYYDWLLQLAARGYELTL